MIFEIEKALIQRIGRIRAECDSIGTPVKPSQCHKRLY